ATEQAKQTLALVPEAKRNDPAVDAAHAALEVAEQAKSVGPIADLEQKVAANPLDHQARFDLALGLNAKGRRQEAVDNLLDIVRRDRKWNDDGARKQLLRFFEAWGPTDEATGNGRQRRWSTLFSGRAAGPAACRGARLRARMRRAKSGRIAAVGERRCP